MRKLAALMLFLFMAGGAWVQSSGAKDKPQAFVWREFKTAFTEAQASKKMIFVEVYAQW